MKVSELIKKAYLILIEDYDASVRWSKEEAIGWLNDAYSYILLIAPSAGAVIEEFTCVAGTKQSLPNNGTALISIIRNISGNGSSITPIDRNTLDTICRNWHIEEQTEDQEHYIYEEMVPKQFYVYPPAIEGSIIEIAYPKLPEKHTLANIETDDIRFDSRYESVLIDYILYRCFQKDSDSLSSDSRSQNHYRQLMTALDIKIKNDLRITAAKGGN